MRDRPETGNVAASPDRRHPAIIERAGGSSPFVIVCEHASNVIPEHLAGLGLTPQQVAAHIAWDPGALGLARTLAAELDAPLVHAPLSRLVYDLNRAPDSPGAIATRSEIHDIPGNTGLTLAQRLARMETVYLPFHARLSALIATRLMTGPRPVVVTIHSFTPVWFGTPRAVECGVIHDADARLAESFLALADRPAAHGGLGLRCAMNAPYSAADDVTHLLRRQALPLGLANVMLEFRNDLIGDAAAQRRIGLATASLLAHALERMERAGAGYAGAAADRGG